MARAPFKPGVGNARRAGQCGWPASAQTAGPGAAALACRVSAGGLRTAAPKLGVAETTEQSAECLLLGPF